MHSRRPVIQHRGWIAALGVLLLGLWGCTPGVQGAGVPTFVAPTPRATAGFLTRPTYEVTRGTLTDVLTLRGEAVAPGQVSLSFPVSGIIGQVHAQAGDEVAAGAVIAELSVPSLEQEVLQRRSNLTITQLELAKLEARVPNTETLAATSSQAFDLAIAQERVALAEALAQHAQAQLDATVLTAPFEGTLIGLTRQQGSRVDAYESVAVLVGAGDPAVRVMLPAASRDRVTVGDAVTVRLDGAPQHAYTGVVAAIAAEPTPWDRSLAHAMEIDLDPDQDLPPIAQIGVEVELVHAVHEDVPWVPASALIMVGDRAYLDVIQDEGLARVEVTLGITGDQQVEIVQGVQAGDTIVFP